MKTRQTLLVGLAGLGFVLALPAQAGPQGHDDFLRAEAHENRFAQEYRVLVAKNDNGDSGSASRRDPRDEPRAKDSKKHQTRDAEPSSESQDYGYGYERRRQEQSPRDGDDHGRK